MIVKLISHTNEPEKVVAAAAKLCYSNSKAQQVFSSLTTESAERFIRKLQSLGHDSPLEHASFTFAIEGVSRSLLAQVTRHRIASYSVQSQRYVDMNSSFAPIEPAILEKIPEANKEYKAAMRNAANSYKKIQALVVNAQLWNWGLESLKNFCDTSKVNIETTDFMDFLKKNNITDTNTDENVKDFADLARRKKKEFTKIGSENARSVLPNACNTQLMVTMNARELLNFFKLRCCNRAQAEVRELAWRMLIEVQKVAPALFEHAGPTCLHGGCTEGSFCCGKPFKPAENSLQVNRINNSYLCIFRRNNGTYKIKLFNSPNAYADYYSTHSELSSLEYTELL